MGLILESPYKLDMGLAAVGLDLADLDIDEIEELWDSMDPQEQHDFEALIRNSSPISLMPHQIVPVHLEWWETYLLVGGRGVGKTATGSYASIDHLRTFGPRARIGIGAPTNADARDTCMEGETGLYTMFQHEFLYYNRSLGEARHVNGGLVKAMGTEKPRKWNGPQWSMLWFDELALCTQAAWDMALFGLRLGIRPYAVCTTTPKNRKWVKKLALDKTTYVPQYITEDGKLRLPTTLDNQFLPQRRVNWLYNKYGGSRLGRQELEGIFVDDIEGAMWKRSMFTHVTDPEDWPWFQRIVVAIDPAGSRSRRDADKNALTEEDRQNQRKNADTAIAVMALGTDGRFWLLACKSGQWSPSEWAREAIRLFHEFKADKIIAEKNYGGDMVESNLRNLNEWDRVSARQLVGRHLPIQLVTASRGKDIRAEPIATMYEQKRVIHGSYFAEAEDQMCAFIDAEDNEGADMVDAIVWAGTELGGLDIGGNQFSVVGSDPRMRAFVVR